MRRLGFGSTYFKFACNLVDQSRARVRSGYARSTPSGHRARYSRSGFASRWATPRVRLMPRIVARTISDRHGLGNPRASCAFEIVATHEAACASTPRRRNLGRRQHVFTANQPAHACFLHVEPDLEDVTVSHLVILALDPQLLQLARLCPGADLEQLTPVDHLGADETAL